jgi:hypothetical protein
MDTQYIDLVSLDGNKSVIFNFDDTMSTGNGTISITANDVFVKGVDVQDKNFTIATNLNLLRVENCNGGNFSFGGDPSSGSNPITVSGTFENCTAGNSSFGANGTASGVFKNCKGNLGSFAGGSGSIASGTFINCTSGDFSFGGAAAASGTFTDCIGGSSSFGGGIGTLTGKLFYCRLTAGTFQTVSSGGRTYYCVDGNGDPNNQ